MMRIGIVGAGMAGLACAEGLARHGHHVILFDKGRGPGGRMSTRRLSTQAGEVRFDHGAQYFTVRDDAFRRRVDAWTADGIVAPWPSAGNGAYVGVPAMNAPIRQMAGGQKVLWSTRVERIESDGPGWRLIADDGESVDVDIVVLALPAEQASALLATVDPDLAACAAAVPTDPCWTTMLAFSESVPVAQNCWRGQDIIGWAARNSSKPGRTGPESWVVQSNPDWSRRHIEADASRVSATLKDALSSLLASELPPTIAEVSHRWRFARSSGEGASAIWQPVRRIGLCGDWLIGPRVEAAWLSGTDLAGRIDAALKTSGHPQR